MRDLGASMQVIPGTHPGLLKPGNINLLGRAVVHNPDGSISTEHSFSIGVGGHEVLIPQVVHGRMLSVEQAIAHFQQTGENLGVFTSPKTANRYAIRLHEHQARVYGGR